jgi:hypothetical protein
MRASSIALLVLGLAVGAGAVLLADPGDTESSRTLPVEASETAVAASDATHDHGSAEDVASGWTALGENGHQHGEGIAELDDATQAALSVQLAPTALLVEKYPTLADAEAAGWRRAGRFNPGLGVHYQGSAGSAEGIINGVNGEAMLPQLIYDGTDPGSPLAGFMYMADGPDGAVPEGFVGPNDHWHSHDKLCISFDNGAIEVLLRGEDEPTKAKCDAVHGMWIVQSGYMVHVWTVPGYESPDGVFSGLNRKLACPDGTYLKTAGKGTPDSTCKNPEPA